jgi:hypothetical protein
MNIGWNITCDAPGAAAKLKASDARGPFAAPDSPDARGVPDASQAGCLASRAADAV